MLIVETDNLRKEYGTLIAVNDVNLTIGPGQVMGLVGPNGAGKTTFLRMLATLLPPTRGAARILGHDLHRDYLKIRKQIGYLPDFFNLYNDLTLRECLEFFARSYRVPRRLIREKVNTALTLADLLDKQNDFIRHLSRGMVQRMGLAVLLVRDPDLFLLDEPASGLDPKARIQLREILKQLSRTGKTIIISSHILTELEGFCTHIAFMNRGRIVQSGAVDEIRDSVSDARIVVLSVLSDAARAQELLRELNEVRIKDVLDGNIIIELTGGLEEMAALNAYLVKHDVKVASFHERRMDIEDMFMKIASAEEKTGSRGA